MGSKMDLSHRHEVAVEVVTLDAWAAERGITTVDRLGTSLETAVVSLQKLGLADAGSARSRIASMQSGANDLASASRQIADGVQLLVDQTKQMGTGLSQASAFLMAMGHDASQPSMDGWMTIPQANGL